MQAPIAKILFDLSITPDQISDFKREILHLQDKGKDIWHNHIVEKEDMGIEGSGNELSMAGNYKRYPLIQFRAEKYGQRYLACLWGMGKGAEEIMHFLNNWNENELNIEWKGRQYSLMWKNVLEDKEQTLEMLPNMQLVPYTLTHFIPFNERRYKEYKQIWFFADKLRLIEQLIESNLQLFAEAIDWQDGMHNQFIVKAIDIKAFRTVKFKKELSYVSVDMKVGINALLPGEISLGNLKAVGYGILRPFNNRTSLKPFSY